jgi:hypothetical protein
MRAIERIKKMPLLLHRPSPLLVLFVNETGCWWAKLDAAGAQAHTATHIPASEYHGDASFPTADQLGQQLSEDGRVPRRAVVLIDQAYTRVTHVSVPTRRRGELHRAAALSAATDCTRNTASSECFFDYISERSGDETHLTVYTAESSIVASARAALSQLNIACECVTPHLNAIGSRCDCCKASSTLIRAYVLEDAVVSLTYSRGALLNVHRRPIAAASPDSAAHMAGELLLRLMSADDAASDSTMSLCINIVGDALSSTQATEMVARVNETASVHIAQHFLRQNLTTASFCPGPLPLLAMERAGQPQASRNVFPDFAHPRDGRGHTKKVLSVVGAAAIASAPLIAELRPDSDVPSHTVTLSELSQRHSMLTAECDALDKYLALANTLRVGHKTRLPISRVLALLSDIRKDGAHAVTVSKCELVGTVKEASHVRVRVSASDITHILVYQEALSSQEVMQLYMHDWRTAPQATHSQRVEADIDIYVTHTPAAQGEGKAALADSSRDA